MGISIGFVYYFAERLPLRGAPAQRVRGGYFSNGHLGATPQSPIGDSSPQGEPLLYLGPGGVNMENGLKALRKLQHSCNF